MNHPMDKNEGNVFRVSPMLLTWCDMPLQNSLFERLVVICAPYLATSPTLPWKSSMDYQWELSDPLDDGSAHRSTHALLAQSTELARRMQQSALNKLNSFSPSSSSPNGVPDLRDIDVGATLRQTSPPKTNHVSIPYPNIPSPAIQRASLDSDFIAEYDAISFYIALD